MLEDVKLIHGALMELEAHLDAMPDTIKVKRARVLASRLHRHMHEAVLNNAENLTPEVVAYSGGTPKPPRD